MDDTDKRLNDLTPDGDTEYLRSVTHAFMTRQTKQAVDAFLREPTMENLRIAGSFLITYQDSVLLGRNRKPE